MCNSVQSLALVNKSMRQRQKLHMCLNNVIVTTTWGFDKIKMRSFTSHMPTFLHSFAYDINIFELLTLKLTSLTHTELHTPISNANMNLTPPLGAQNAALNLWLSDRSKYGSGAFLIRTNDELKQLYAQDITKQIYN